MSSTGADDLRAPLHRDRVLAAAIVLADRDGIGALTMRSLGAALGVQAMSLYNHVANKDDVLDAITDLVVAEIDPPRPEEPWKASMLRRGSSARAVLLRHPWAPALLMSRANVGPGMLRYVDATLRCLLAAGFTLPQADHAWNAMDSFIYGFVLQELNFPFQKETYAAVAAAYLPGLSAEQYPAMHALTSLVAAGRHDGVHTLELGLGLILDGLERELAAAG